MPYQPRIPMVGTFVPKYVLDRIEALEAAQFSISIEQTSQDARLDVVEQELANAFVAADYHLDPSDNPQTVIPVGEFVDLVLSESATPAFIARAVTGAWALDSTKMTAPEGAFYRVYLSGALHVVSGAPGVVTLQGTYNGAPLADVFTVLPANISTEPVGFTLTWLQRTFAGARKFAFKAAQNMNYAQTVELDSLILTAALRFRNEGGVVALP